MVATLGAGQHNFHHVFPYDYRSGEFGQGLQPVTATNFIRLLAKLGLADNLRTVSCYYPILCDKVPENCWFV